MRTIEAASMSPRVGRLQQLLGVLSIALLFPGLITCPAPVV